MLLVPLANGKVAAPVGPVEPVSPVAPVAPGLPCTPDAPVAPAPVAPLNPVVPLSPDAPVAPMVPCMPLAPVAPMVPCIPDAPVAPVLPVSPLLGPVQVPVLLITCPYPAIRREETLAAPVTCNLLTPSVVVPAIKTLPLYCASLTVPVDNTSILGIPDTSLTENIVPVRLFVIVNN